jgi:hypothetical protein
VKVEHELEVGGVRELARLRVQQPPRTRQAPRREVGERLRVVPVHAADLHAVAGLGAVEVDAGRLLDDERGELAVVLEPGDELVLDGEELR